ncbi:MAG: hypothetical protein CMJ81_09020 [Planctomycetaceae bacterium]|nr:hypothetical protein [Planctomycetaceae bacterium]MBP60682.1 hypothetical protein [Planctomycetaceae bacterium]
MLIRFGTIKFYNYGECHAGFQPLPLELIGAGNVKRNPPAAFFAPEFVFQTVHFTRCGGRNQPVV